MGKQRNLGSGIILIVVLAAITIFTVVPEEGTSHLSGKERRIIRKSESVMYVMDVANKSDSLVLRTKCEDFSFMTLKSRFYSSLVRKMLNTVQSEQQGGVGIAAPQVGITHRVVVVCRMDKEDEPFEAYPNIKIDSLYGKISPGPEGCLSIPPYRGDVPRYSDVVISYLDMASMTRKTEHVSGYTAVIFQHECDHLDGILYTDRADTVYINEEWKAEREAFEAQGLYKRPAWLK